MSVESPEIKTGKVADAPNGGASGAPQRGLMARFSSWLIAWLTSVRLTLWLVAILACAMVVATLIPQNMPREGYLKAFGTVFGPIVAGTILRNIFGSPLFVGAFALLTISLTACVVKRAGRLLQQERELPDRVTQQELANGAHTRWRLPQGVEEATSGLTEALRDSGYAVTPVPAGEASQRALFGRRGRLTPWAPVVVHAGLVVVLIGAGWGRMPSHTYRARASLQSGEVYPVRTAGEAFGIRLLDAGAERDAAGHPTKYWAKVEVLEEGDVVRSTTIRSNVPLRYHGISATLYSMTQSSSYGVEVTQGASKSVAPIALSPTGEVDPMSSVTQTDNLAGVVFVHRFREKDEQGREAPAAQVFFGGAGEASHEWQPVGWVGAEPVQFKGITFRLVPVPGHISAELDLDRDVGVPIVFVGFAIVSLGALLVLGAPRSRVTALVAGSGKGSQALVRVSPGGDQPVERLWSQLESGLGAIREAGPRGKRDQTS